MRTEEQRKINLERLKIYYKTTTGRQMRNEWREKNKIKLRAYMKEYMKKRRLIGLEKGLCGNCLKQPKTEKTTLCQTCLEHLRKNSLAQKIRKQNKKKENKIGNKQKEKEVTKIWEAIKREQHNPNDKLEIEIELNKILKAINK